MKRLLLAALAVAVSLAGGVALAADAAFLQLLRPQMGQVKAKAAYSGMFWSEVDVQGSSTSFAMNKQGFSTMTPLMQDDGQELALWLDADVRNVDSDLFLPEVNRTFPDELWDLNLALSYRRKLSQNWIGGVRGSFGSASDKPFNSADELTYNAMGFARRELDKQNALLFFLFYSSAMDFLPGVPYPGVAWQYAAADRSLDLIIGLPMLMATYRPVDPLKLSVAYYPLRNVFGEAAWSFDKQWSTFGRFTWTYQDYLLADRPRDENRLFYYEKRAVVGVGFKPLPEANIELSGGRAFDRLMFQGQNHGDEDQNRIELDDGWLVHLVGSMRF